MAAASQGGRPERWVCAACWPADEGIPLDPVNNNGYEPVVDSMDRSRTEVVPKDIAAIPAVTAAAAAAVAAAEAAAEADAAAAAAAPETTAGVVDARQVLAKRCLGAPCISRMPAVGDEVLCSGGQKVGHDSNGTPSSWKLSPGQVATVVEVDDDGDFRLRNEHGAESGFIFRAEFCFAVPFHEEPILKAWDWNARSSCVDKSGKALEVQSKAMLEVVLVKTDECNKIGLHLDTINESALEVVSVDEGIVKLHNDCAREAEQILPGMFIIEVNGKRDDKTAMLRELLSPTRITLKVARRTTFRAEIAKNCQALGMTVGFDKDCSSICIKAVEQGCVEAYNRRAPKERWIRAGDRIVQINGVAGDCDKMYERLKADSTVRLVIARPLL